MKGLIAIIAIKLVLVTTKCPTDPALIAPCVCYHDTSDVHCTGNITELQLNKLDPVFPWNVLYIYRTNLTIIHNTSLGDTKWDKIYVHNNPVLRTLEADAFKSGPSITLWIANNTYIRNTDVYAVVKRVKNTERIFLEGNEINTMPSYMFDEGSRVNYFRINNNIIRKIRSNTFTGAKNLEVVLLDRNNITDIDQNGLDFTAGGEGQRSVTVIVDDNHLSTNSFNASTFTVTNKDIKIMLSLKNNDLHNISRDVFEPFLANGLNEIDVDNNDFTCDCSFKWLFEKSVEPRVFSIDCVNKHSSLYHLSVVDLCGEEIATTTLTTTEYSTTTTIESTNTSTPTTTTATPSTTLTTPLTTTLLSTNTQSFTEESTTRYTTKVETTTAVPFSTTPTSIDYASTKTTTKLITETTATNSMTSTVNLQLNAQQQDIRVNPQQQEIRVNPQQQEIRVNPQQEDQLLNPSS